jgi:hypothetical protein
MVANLAPELDQILTQIDDLEKIVDVLPADIGGLHIRLMKIFAELVGNFCTLKGN